MFLLNILEKIKLRLWAKLIGNIRIKPYYPLIYKSYWHYKLSSSIKLSVHINYYTAKPNRGAGIGHQMANWIAGYWFSRQFSLHFAHTPFSSDKWEQFLGFGRDETNLEDLLKRGYVKVKLPLFDEFNLAEIAINKSIIESYRDQRVVFVAEQDQFYRDQYGVTENMQEAFYAAPARKMDKLRYSPTNFNIAIHVRRGDIVTGKTSGNPNLLMRWQDTEYFKKILISVLNTIQTDKIIQIYLFSQGERDDFSDFDQFDNIEFCLESGAQESFLHMVFADLLITSKSSFSYKPALLSKGIKVCPRDFWHGYPENEKWIIAEEDGSLGDLALNQLYVLSTTLPVTNSNDTVM